MARRDMIDDTAVRWGSRWTGSCFFPSHVGRLDSTKDVLLLNQYMYISIHHDNDVAGQKGGSVYRRTT